MTAAARDSPWCHSGAGSRGSHCLVFAVPARGQCTEKQQQLNHHKGFPVEKQSGYEESLSCIRWWVCNKAAFPTISDSNRAHCAIVLKQSRLLHKEHKQSSAARREQAWVHPYVCEAEEKSSSHSKNRLWIWNPLGKREPTEEQTKR